MPEKQNEWLELQQKKSIAISPKYRLTKSGDNYSVFNELNMPPLSLSWSDWVQIANRIRKIHGDYCDSMTPKVEPEKPSSQ